MRKRTDEGFTLVETLVTVVITGIIGGAVVASIIIGLRTTDATANRLADSRDAQLAAAYFGTDVQGADEVNLAPSPPPSPSPPLCEAAVHPVVDLIDSGGAAPSLVTYATEITADCEMNLRRIARKGTDVVADVVVATDLEETRLPVATCDPLSCTAKPTQVKMIVAVRGCSALQDCREGIDSSPYEYELLGTTRSTGTTTATAGAP